MAAAAAVARRWSGSNGGKEGISGIKTVKSMAFGIRRNELWSVNINYQFMVV